MPIIAAIQINGSSDIERNLSTTEALVRDAARAGAKFIATPEATTYLGPHDKKIQLAEEVDGPTHRRLSNLAAECGVTLLVGSVAERCDDTRAYNTSLLFGPDGALLASYRKMHLFDVDLSASGGVCFKESDTTGRGKDLVVADTEVGRVGLSICFDLRFPEVYRALCDQGATILAVPSAFTLMTGKDHWHTLLKARAIENQAWVVGVNRVGKGGSLQYAGDSAVIDPWGEAVTSAAKDETLLLADIDPERVRHAREVFPVLEDRRG